MLYRLAAMECNGVLLVVMVVVVVMMMIGIFPMFAVAVHLVLA